MGSRNLSKSEILKKWRRGESWLNVDSLRCALSAMERTKHGMGKRAKNSLCNLGGDWFCKIKWNTALYMTRYLVIRRLIWRDIASCLRHMTSFSELKILSRRFPRGTLLTRAHVGRIVKTFIKTRLIKEICFIHHLSLEKELIQFACLSVERRTRKLLR